MKQPTRLLDLGRVSRKTKGLPFLIFFEQGMPPNNWWILW